MATKYWTAGGNGNWSSATNWSTTSGSGRTANTTAPGTTDAAVFDAISGSGTATLDISPTIQTLTCTGFTGTLAFGANTITLTNTGNVFIGATTMSVSGTPLIILNNATTTATRTINATAVTEANSISFNITAGSGTAVLTVTGSGAVRDLNFTGYTGSHNSTSYTMYGSLTLGTGMTVTAGSTTTFAATSGTKTITTNSVTFDKGITFNGAGGTFQLVGALTSGNSRTCTLTAGTLDLNNNTLTIGQFASNNANVRTLAFGSSGIITITSSSTTSNLTVFTTSDSTNLTITGNGNVYVTGNSSGFIRSILPGLISSSGTESNSLNFFITTGSDTISFGTSSRVFNSITFNNGFTGNLAADAAPYIYGNLILSVNMTVTGGTNAWVFAATSGINVFDTGNLSIIDNPITFSGVAGRIIKTLTLGSTRALTLTNGSLQISEYAGTHTVGSFVTTGSTLKYLDSIDGGQQFTISDASGTNSVSYLSIANSNAIGGATFNAFYDLGNINAGNNSGWYFGDSPTLGNEITMRLRSFTQPRRF